MITLGNVVCAVEQTVDRRAQTLVTDVGEYRIGLAPCRKHRAQDDPQVGAIEVGDVARRQAAGEQPRLAGKVVGDRA